MRFSLLLLLSLSINCIQSQSNLVLKEIMRGQKFIGHWPQEPNWSADGTTIYFYWNRDDDKEDSPYAYNLASSQFTKLTKEDFETAIFADKSQYKYADQYQICGQSLVRFNKKSKKTEVIYQSSQLLSQLVRENDTELTFLQGDNFVQISLLGSGAMRLKLLTNYQKDQKVITHSDTSFLQNQQKELFQYISNQTKEAPLKPNAFSLPKAIFLPNKGELSSLNFNFKNQVVFIRTEEETRKTETKVTHFITENGFTTESAARAKVSEAEPRQFMYLHNLTKDTLFALDFSRLSNIRRKPLYLDSTGVSNYESDRTLFIHDPVFSSLSPLALLDIRAADNKDRWIVSVDLETGVVEELNRQHDEAWIGGPGISSWNMEDGTLGFVDKDQVVYYQSEENGFSQLYELDLKTKNQKLVYPGGTNFEMYSVDLSQDQQSYFITHNMGDPGTRSLSSLHRVHQKMVELTPNKNGGFQVVLSPDERSLAYLYSNSTKPWELFHFDLKSQKEKQITISTKETFSNYTWKSPEILSFMASDSVQVRARLYEPSEKNKNGAAVLFVHGAGYLQNAHNFWSSYYREFMFHNLLVDLGYTVMDVDYRASEGYGRDYRTAIYRHMGGRDLLDYVDAKKFLTTQKGIDSNRVGIYGGSYGGFITLMALFTKPKEFACGAALRSVTDWAHYNHEYTSNILNYPETDPESFKQSSPIYHADGLIKPLLILHGMVDDNVQYQDVVRLQQKLIELEKTNWELASYPVENHGFKEDYSWFDEYRRILDLFNKNLLK